MSGYSIINEISFGKYLFVSGWCNGAWIEGYQVAIRLTQPKYGILHNVHIFKTIITARSANVLIVTYDI